MKKMFYGVSALALMAFAPVASAGYWAGHAEVIRDIIKNWILHNQTRVEQPVVNGNAVQQHQIAPSSQIRR